MTKREFIKHLSLATGGVALSSCAGSSFLPSYLISNEMIISQLLPHFPFNKSLSGIGSIGLTSPSVSFAPDINKVRMNMGVQIGLGESLALIPGLSSLANSLQKGTCQLACGLRYDRNTRGIYLKDPTIESLQLNGVGNNYSNRVTGLVNALAPSIFNQYAIHTLQPSIATTFLGSMTVKDNGIALGFGL